MDEGVSKRALCDSLQALSLPAPDQVRVTEPGCVTCELSLDFESWSEKYLESCGGSLSEEQRAAIDAVSRALDGVPEADFECFDTTALDRPSWQSVRSAVERALASLGWPRGAPSAYVEASPGIWERRHS